MPHEKEYKIRPAFSGGETAEMTLPTNWTRYHRLKFGDKVKVLADGVIVVLPPGVGEEEEQRARRFIEGGEVLDREAITKGMLKGKKVKGSGLQCD